MQTNTVNVGFEYWVISNYFLPDISPTRQCLDPQEAFARSSGQWSHKVTNASEHSKLKQIKTTF